MTVNNRVRLVRSELGFTQKEFGARIAVAQNYLSNIEKGYRDVTEKIIKIICSEFNVSEEWIKNGKGEMFVQSSTFSLDEYAKKSGLSTLETDIIKGYMELDSDIRKGLMNHFKAIFASHAETSATREESIDDEVEKYRSELEAEKKGAILSVSEGLRGISS